MSKATVSTGPGSGRAAERYIDQYRAFSQNGAGSEPAWLVERREQAIGRFADLGFPTTRQESWRFTDVKPIAERPFELATGPTSGTVAAEVIARGLLRPGDGHQAVFVNGRFAAGVSSLDGLPAGVRVGGLRGALATDAPELERHLAGHAAPSGNPFADLNTAFIGDGAFVHVPRDVVLERPIQLVFVAVPDGGGALVVHPRTLVVLDRGAQASLVESYVAAADGTYWTNAVTELVVGENANLDHYRIQRDSQEAYHTATTQSSQARSSVYSSITFAFGGALARHDINAVLDGEGAECTVNGLTVLADRQHVDHHTTLDHARPHCNSWEFFNGIFADRARGVFNGRIIVRPGAQKTDSKQTNNNLLLSRSARADSQPQLEIYADDVKCTHGATLGPIDERQLFYMESRGLPPEEARSLLTYGFAVEILGNVTVEALRQQLDALVQSRLGEMARRHTAA